MNIGTLHHLNVHDVNVMQEVFKSGQPWLILCTEPDTPLPPVFEKAIKILFNKKNENEYMDIGVMDCTKTLPSGKSVLARFHLKSSIFPTVFTVANGEKPHQIVNVDTLYTGKALVKKALGNVKKRHVQVSSTETLKTKCLKSTYCVLLLRNAKLAVYEKQWMEKLMKEFKKVSFVWMDANVVQIVVPDLDLLSSSGGHRMVMLHTLKAEKEDKKKVHGAVLYDDVNYYPVRQFILETIANPSKSILLNSLTIQPKNRNKEENQKTPKKNSKKKKEKKKEKAPKEQQYYEDQEQGSHDNKEVEVEEVEVVDLD